MIKKIKTPYFQGDPVPLKFKVQVKENDIALSSARVSVFSGKEEVIHDAPCEIEKNLVTFTVPSGVTKNVGDYRADFTVQFAPNVTRSHIIRFHIAQRGAILGEKEDKELMPVDETSGEYQITIVIAQATRNLRRTGTELSEAARIARDLAEQMTGRKI